MACGAAVQLEWLVDSEWYQGGACALAFSVAVGVK
jgi:hypothetical protein